MSGSGAGAGADSNVDWWAPGRKEGARAGGWLHPSSTSQAGGGLSEVAEEFIFLAPVHLRGPLATAFLVGPLFSHSQGDVEVQDGIGGGGGR